MEPTRSSCLVVRARAIWTVLALLGLLAAVPGITAHADDAGYALAFDGINDLVLLPETVSVMGAGWETTKTVSLWVKPTGSAVTCAYNNVAECDAIFGDRSRWWGIVRGVLNGQDRLWVWNYDASSGSPFDILPVDYVPGKWVHVTLVQGAGSLRAYRNGVQVGGTPSGATRQPTGGALTHLYLGGIINNTSRNWTFEGVLDEVSLWNAARTEAEVQADMFRALAGNEPGLRAYYAMSDGSGVVLTDDGPADWNGALLDGMQGVPPNGGPAQWILSDAFSGTSSTTTPTITGLPSVSPTTTLTPTETSTPTATAIASSTPTPGQPGEFPTTGILDAFNRPNGAIGAAWSGSVSSYAIASEHLDVNGNGSIFWNGTSFGADQEAFVTLSAVDAGAGSISLLLKSQANTTANSGVLRVMYLPATQVVQIWSYSSSQGWVQRGTNLSASLAAGDQLGAKAKADGSIEVYRNGALLGVRSATGWTFAASGGFVGLWMSNASNVVLDDFGGGSSGASPLPTASATPTATPAGPTVEPTSTSTPTETIVVPTPTASSTPLPGSFPVTGTLDDFDRADGVIGSNWSGSVSAYAVAGHRLDVNANGSIQWNAGSFGADQEAFVTVAVLDGGSGSVSLVLKSQSSTGSTDGALRVMFSPSSQLAQVWTLTAGQGWVQRGSNVTMAVASGDVLGARARADGMVEIFRNGNLVATRDASGWANAGAPGYVGLWMSSATNTLLDDFGGGTVTD